jgi:hypothetical protein
MKKKVNIDKDVLKFFYIRYKNYLIPVCAILACLILFIYVITPQIQNIQALQNQEKQEANRLEVLKNNLNLLYNLDSKTLDNQLRLTSNAVPVDKDFIGILNGVAIAASKSNSTLGDYGFQVGDIGKAPSSVKGIPSMQLQLVINGNIATLLKFIKELKETVPLSEIKAISLTNNAVNLTTLFYYEPLPPVRIKDDAPLSPLSSSVLEVISNLTKMNNANSTSVQETSTPIVNSSPSAIFSGM